MAELLAQQEMQELQVTQELMAQVDRAELVELQVQLEIQELPVIQEIMA
jgi:hypothetical protein